MSIFEVFSGFFIIEAWKYVVINDLQIFDFQRPLWMVRRVMAYQVAAFESVKRMLWTTLLTLKRDIAFSTKKGG